MSGPGSEMHDLLARLVAIDSTNPELGPGTGEAQIAEFCRAWLVDRGVDAWIQDTGTGDRPNVIGRVGTGAGPTLMLNAHLDTVGVGGMPDPFTPRIDENGRLHGRGAIDTKSGLAALMVATVRAVGMGLGGTVLFTGVADEEWGSIGTETVLTEFTADGAIVSEPTNLEVVIAHQGFAWLEIETVGRAAHGSRPDLGVDAITMMGPVLTGLAEIGAALASQPGHALLGPGSLHASIIEGGYEASTYPARCTVGFERRTLPGETGADVLAEVGAMLERIGSDDPRFVANATLGFERGAYEIAADHPLTLLLLRHGETVTGRSPGLGHHLAWMDSALLGAAGIPSVVMGPVGEGLHADVEWVDLASVDTFADIVTGAIREFCGDSRV